MDKEDYNTKVNVMLSDTNTYKKLTRDPTQAKKRILIQKLTKLEKEGKITKEQYKSLYPTSEITPRIYCPPKIHKKDNPLRPVVDYTGSITYNTARAIADLLNPLVGNTEHHIKDSKDLTEKLRNTKIKDDHMLVSHDVVSLFTKVPIPEALKVIETRLKEGKTLRMFSALIHILGLFQKSRYLKCFV